MTPDTASRPAPRTTSSRGPALSADSRATPARTLASELVKLATVRSTLMPLLVAGVCILGIGLVGAVATVVSGVAPDGGATDLLRGSLNGVGVAQLFVLGLGVSAATGEYATGTVNSTLTAQPRRAVLAASKATAVAVAAAGLVAVAVLTTYVAASAVLAGRPEPVPWPPLEVWRALAGAVIGLTFVAVAGTAFGHLLRSTAAAYAVAAGVLYLPDLLVLLLPGDVGAQAAKYTPGHVGAALMQLQPGAYLSWLPALAVLLAYLAVVSAWSTYRLTRRDI